MTNDHRFDVWAPHAREVTVRVDGVDHPMAGLAERPGWWTLAAVSFGVKARAP